VTESLIVAPDLDGPCPCNSGKPAGRCHLAGIAVDSSARLPEDVRRVADAMSEKQALHFRDFGHLMPIGVTHYSGRTVFFAGSRVFFAPAETTRTVPDVLHYYLAANLGEEWRRAEASRPREERHTVITWLEERTEGIRGGIRAGGLVGLKPTGGVMALLLLSFELFALESTGKLQERLIERLKDRKQFQGARYELSVFATLARAGFDIVFENEDDRTRQHVECTATHRQTGQRLAVEAKSRHRPGTLGFQGPTASDPWKNLDSLLKRALEKPTAEPLIVFVDLNLPSSGVEAAGSEWLPALSRATAAAMRRMGLRAGVDPEPFNVIIATNNPLHYFGPGAPVPSPAGASITARTPRRSVTHASALEDLQASVEKLGKVPTTFA
jgi:hypothetical protein